MNYVFPTQTLPPLTAISPFLSLPIEHVVAFVLFIYLWKELKLNANDPIYGKAKKFAIGHSILAFSNLLATVALIVPLFMGAVGSFIYIFVLAGFPVVKLLWVVGLILVYTSIEKPDVG